MAKTNINRIQTSLDANGKIIAMPIHEAKLLAPAAFATNQSPTITSRSYKFTPTEEVIGHMEQLGFKMIAARQSKARVELNQSYGTHIISFQHDDLYINGNGRVEARPTVHLLNNHIGTGPVQFELGIYRLACSNGLVVKQADLGGFRERHTKYTFPEIKNLIDGKLGELDRVTETLNSWHSRELTPQERFNMAMEAIALRSGGDRLPTAEEVNNLLKPRREEDHGEDLYHTFNVIQEAITQGGTKLNNRTMRHISSPTKDFSLNQALWNLAAKYGN